MTLSQLLFSARQRCSKSCWCDIGPWGCWELIHTHPPAPDMFSPKVSTSLSLWERAQGGQCRMKNAMHAVVPYNLKDIFDSLHSSSLPEVQKRSAESKVYRQAGKEKNSLRFFLSFGMKILKGKCFTQFPMPPVCLLTAQLISNKNWKPRRGQTCSKPIYYLLFKNELSFVSTNRFGFHCHFHILESRKTNAVPIRSSTALAFSLAEGNGTIENTALLCR